MHPHHTTLAVHNTTAPCGVLLCMARDDALGHAVAAHLISLDSDVRVAEWSVATDDHPFLPSVGRSGCTFEVQS